MSKGRGRSGDAASVAPKDETPEDKFHRLGKKRANRAIKAIEVVGYCFGVGYKWTSEDAVKLIAALTDAVGNIEAKSMKAEVKGGHFGW